MDVNFLDFSWANTSIQSWFWDFDDGTTSSSQNPQHTYSTPGIYDVTLTIQADSCISSTVYTIWLDSLNSQDCFADFYYDYAPGMTGVVFIDQSWASTPIQTWLWDFGDGNTSTLQNPIHTYSATGLYFVELTITSDSCTSTMLQPVWYDNIIPQDCFADFTYSASGLNVDFFDFSWAVTPIQSWFWDFGDGTTSSLQNPAHTYSSSGVYDVELTIIADSCVSSIIYSVWLAITNPYDCYASFLYIPDTLSVEFIDDSYSISGNIQSWSWDFGDGNISSVQNPVHIYTLAGLYVVTLSIQADSCAHTISIPVVVNSGSGNGIPNGGGNGWFPGMNGCQAMFVPDITGQSVDFYNSSISYDTSVNYIWTFGDGISSTDINPTHVYAANDTYTVNLVLISSSCTSVFEMDLYINSATNWGSTCQALFFPVVDSTGTSVTFIDMSMGTPTSWLWDFGDGTASADQGPAHTYTTLGSYLVTLNIAAPNCSSDITVLVDLANQTFTPMAAYNVLAVPAELVSNNINIYPNPMMDYVTVEFLSKRSEAVEIMLFDFAGRKLIDESSRLHMGNNKILLPVNYLSKGTYLLRIEGEVTEYSCKLIK